jgi:EAL domain-containing protein (putative c-di-GMP-specific phosphodiesterase class I)
MVGSVRVQAILRRPPKLCNRALCDDSNDATIVNAIIGMSRGLNIQVIAEGVETQEQVDILRKMGCDLLQGFALGRPMSPINLQQELRQSMTWRP